MATYGVFLGLNALGMLPFLKGGGVYGRIQSLFRLEWI